VRQTAKPKIVSAVMLFTTNAAEGCQQSTQVVTISIVAKLPS
jgi:hypothetical protein